MQQLAGLQKASAKSKLVLWKKHLHYAKNKLREHSGEDSQPRRLRGLATASLLCAVFVCSRAKANTSWWLMISFFSSSTGHSTVSEIKVNSSAINSCHNSSRWSSCFSLSNKTLEEKKPSSAWTHSITATPKTLTKGGWATVQRASTNL